MYWFSFALCLLVSESYSELIVLNTGTERLFNFFPLHNGNLDFAVSATYDVHVLLTNIPKYEGPYYEIILGGWYNTKSVIMYNIIDQVETSGAVLETRPYFSKFSVRVNYTEGSVSVFKGKSVNPMMYLLDPNFIDVSYFGLSTGMGYDGIFHFDNVNVKCPPRPRINNYYSSILNENLIGAK